jgi:hypothetical protein
MDRRDGVDGSGIGGTGGAGVAERSRSALLFKEMPKSPARLLRLGTDLRLVAADGERCRSISTDSPGSMTLAVWGEAGFFCEMKGECGSVTTRRVGMGGGSSQSWDGWVTCSVGGRTWEVGRLG